MYAMRKNSVDIFGVLRCTGGTGKCTKVMAQTTSQVSFRGNRTHKLDPKGRVAVPSGWGVPAESTLILIDAARDEYPVVKCYTEENFAAMLEKIRRIAEERGEDPGDIDDYVGDITAWSEEVEVSTQGKMLIPKQHREGLNLGETAVLAGRDDYFEIWNPLDFEAAYPPTVRRSSGLDRIFHIRASRVQSRSSES